jgi:hypothetical protein
MINCIHSFNSKSKVKTRTKTKSNIKIKTRNRKEELKVKTFELKDGPLSWEEFTEHALQSLIKSQSNMLTEEPKFPPASQSTQIFQNNSNKNSIFSTSDNSRSKTFRTVSPFDDTTVNNLGQKYSKLYQINNNKNVKSGYMGRTRLTRL